MNALPLFDRFQLTLADFVLLAVVGVGVWWLFDAAVPASWCAGGRFDIDFIYPLFALVLGCGLGPARGRRPGPRRILLAICAAVTTVASVLAGRLIAGCSDIEGEVSTLDTLPHFLSSTGIGLLVLTAYLMLARLLPASEDAIESGRPSAGAAALSAIPSVALVAMILCAAQLIFTVPDLLEDVAAARFDGYCPYAPGARFLYFLALLPLAGVARQDSPARVYGAIALTGLAAIALMSAAEVLSGLLVACPPTDGHLHVGRWFLKLGVILAGVIPAGMLCVRLENRYRRPDGETGAGGTANREQQL